MSFLDISIEFLFTQVKNFRFFIPTFPPTKLLILKYVIFYETCIQ